LGTELIGGARPDSEAEVIALADETLTSVGITGDIHVGYLGLIRHILMKIAPEHRANILRMIDKKDREHLKEFLEDVGGSHLGLLELIDLKGEAALNKAMEISLDLGDFEDRASSIGTISKARHYDSHANGGRTSARFGKEWKTEPGIEEFQEMIELLRAYGVEFTIDFEIVRGLEYYSGTVFEIYATGLGAQHQICGGGSYELASVFGGAKTNSTGFGLGFDRIMEIAKIESSRKPPLFLVFTSDVKVEAIDVARQLRYRIPVILDVMGRDLGAQLKSAGNAGAEYVIIVGRTELDSGKYTFRNMNNGQQQSLTLKEITEMMATEYCVQ